MVAALTVFVSCLCWYAEKEACGGFAKSSFVIRGRIFTDVLGVCEQSMFTSLILRMPLTGVA